MRRGLTFRGMVGAFTVAIVLLVPFGMWSFGFQPPWLSPPGPPLPPVSAFRILSELVTTEVHLSTTIEGGNSEWQTRYLVHGQAHLGIDLSQVRYTRIDPVQRLAVLRLPQPHLIMSKVDHDRSEELWMRSQVWFASSSPQLVRAEVWKAADHKIEKLGQEPTYVTQTKKQAELVLLQLVQGLNWTIRFEWEDVNPKAKDGLQPGDQPNARLASQPGLPARDAADEIAANGPRYGATVPLPTP